MNKKNLILVIIPAYNEEENLKITINNLKQHVTNADILVVDDCSKDRTVEIAKDLNVTVISLPINLRIGGAVQTGLKFAKKLGYDIAVQLDADGQHDPSGVPILIEQIENGTADISIGSRYSVNENFHVPFFRNVGIKFFSWLTTSVTGCQITDCSSGFRALNRKAIALFADEYPVDFPDAEALIFAHKFGLKLTEVSVKFHARKNGKSSLCFWRFLWYPFKETFSILMLLTKD